MKTLLDKPLFQIKPDVSARQYVNCSNLLEVVTNSRAHTVAVQVPACLFQLMLFLKVPVGADVSLYLDQEGSQMVFGLCVNGTEIHDLWTYTRASLPPFLACN